VADRAVWSSVVVVVKPGTESRGPLIRACIYASVGPVVLKRLNESLGLAIGARSVGTRAEVAQVELPASLGVVTRDVAGAVVGHHPLDSNATLAEPSDGPAKEGGGGHAALVWQHLDIGEPARVVDTDVDEVPADDAATAALGARLGDPAPRSAPEGAMTWARKASQLLDVDVDELARARAP
jgi:hypothetical protein